jgi:hypothetical protein
MKNFILILSFLVAALAIISCEDDAAKITVKEEPASNSLNKLSATTYALDINDGEKSFETFSWTTPDFGFPAAITYSLQMDKAGNNFSTAKTLTTATTLSGSIKIKDLNKTLLDMGFKALEESNVEFRVQSTINSNVKTLYSNIIEAKLTPYKTTLPPIYMIGDATGGWSLTKAVEIKSGGLGQFETVTEFTAGNFRFFAEPLWDAQQYKWADFTTIDAKLSSAGDGDDNFTFIGTPGWYTIKVNLSQKTIQLTATDKPALYMIGDALKGWELGKAVELTRLSSGIFKTKATFTKDKAFRFFTRVDWSAGTINYPYFSTVDPLFVSDGGADGNLKFIGETGDFDITVDLNTLSVTMAPASAATPIYMIGDGTGGWNLDTDAVEVAPIGTDKYETTATFTNGGKFRFLTAKDWTAPAYNWSTFTGGTVDARLLNGNDSDGNFLFNGATGSYKITVDVASKTILLTP